MKQRYCINKCYDIWYRHDIKRSYKKEVLVNKIMLECQDTECEDCPDM